MDVTFRGRHSEVPEALQDLARKKLQRLERHLPTAAEAVVEVRWEGVKAADERYIAQITLNCNGTYLRAEDRSRNLSAALDMALDRLARQVDRYTEKLHVRRRPTAKAAEVAPGARQGGEEGEETPLDKIGRVKSFPVKPMTAEEAIEQMELLGHDFFLFLNSNSQQYNVVYRRRDGDYALIEPQAG